VPIVFLAAVQGSIVGVVMIRAKGTNRAEEPPAALPPVTAPADSPPTAEEDWIPPPHAVPFGPFLALGALEQLLIGAALQSVWFQLLGRLWR
jgi:leader peptidase (prepilin peptidase)/N-methyltransferase